MSGLSSSAAVKKNWSFPKFVFEDNSSTGMNTISTSWIFYFFIYLLKGYKLFSINLIALMLAHNYFFQKLSQDNMIFVEGWLFFYFQYYFRIVWLCVFYIIKFRVRRNFRKYHWSVRRCHITVNGFFSLLRFFFLSAS